MISNRPMIPMLTHVDNLGDLNLDMSAQEQSLERIVQNTDNTVVALEYNGSVEMAIRDSVGRTDDASTTTTVIGLLKSIVNKLS